MAEIIPFTPGDPNQDLTVTLDGEPWGIVARWNGRDNAWYLDIYEADRKPIAMSIKVVLGVKLGRKYTHRFFSNRALIAWDESNTGIEAGLDDLGSRVSVIYMTEADLALAGMPGVERPR